MSITSRPRELALGSLGALGIVYGDIGTSPLYAMKECLAFPSSPHAVVSTEATLTANTLGVLSLMLWALFLVVCVKYLMFVLRADNKGEGGILALAALLVGNSAVPRTRKLALPLLLGLFGAGLLFGDGAITPAITILGAMEGLAEHSPALGTLAVPITIAILVGLFLIQRHGTHRIGTLFGPVMLLWFVTIGALGLRHLVREPSVLRAIDPSYAVAFVRDHGVTGFAIMGLVFLVVTGGEALYADMGHFGKRPIRFAWFTIALPGLLLNYFGQAALLISRPPGTVTNPFFALAEGPLVMPVVILATLAAIIASQALISGVFSLTRQAMQLGFWPRVTVVHTSASTEGQIYIPEMNWLLMVGCIALVLQFQTSSGLAAAYGIAVTGTMAITSYLFFLVCRQRWRYSPTKALAILIPFLAIDLTFFSANATKIAYGGWFPLATGLVVYVVMTTWWRGRLELARTMEAGTIADATLLADVAASSPPRVRGTAVYMTSTTDGMPNVLLHHLKHNQVLHQQVVLLVIKTEPVPSLNIDNQLTVTTLGHGFFRVIAKVGFMQTPHVPQILERCATVGLVTERMTTTYYLGKQTLLTTGPSKLARWRKLLFSFLSRNARSPTAFFGLPPNRVVELGLQIEL
ncbi:MAG: potassium transporter Kup [Kofleriaceae bacterium]